jgi:hypothetical protein
MKKLVLTTVCAMAMASAALAQGNLTWSAIGANAMTAMTNTTQLSPLFGGTAQTGTSGYTAINAGGFMYELLYNTAFTGSLVAKPTTLAGLSSWLDAGLSAGNSTASAGKLTPISGSTAASVPWAAGVTNNIMLVGWSMNLGSTWTAVSTKLQAWDNSITGAFFGMSNTGFIAPSTANPGIAPFGTVANAGGTPINSVNTMLYALPVPEPATFALFGLGGLGLLLFRRRQ